MKTIRKTLRYLKKYMPLIVVALLLTLGSVIISLYIPTLIGKAIDQIVKTGMDISLIVNILGKSVILVGITAILQWLMSMINNKVTFFVVRDIRNEAFSKIQKLPLKYLDEHPYGEIVSRIIADADQFADGLLMGFTQLFAGIITIFGTLFFMVTINFKIAILVVLLTPLSLVVANYISKKTYKLFLKQSQTRGEETAYIDEMIGNEKTVKAFGYEEKAIETFDEINERLKICSLKALFYSSLTNPCTRFVNAVIYAAIAITGALCVIGGTFIGGGMSVGALSCFLNYASQYTKPFNEISGVITELQNALACASRIFELIGEKEEPTEEGYGVLGKIDGYVECRDVSFSYQDDEPLIEHFSLNVKPGENVAIVGPTGCGKTTFINLLMRFYRVKGGAISVDKKDIATITKESLRQNYGMVLQDTWLKSGTILENIKMGKEDATMDEVINAAKEAHAHSFIMRLPNGYDTKIGEDGGILSQGQKQLLCITRVMLALPPMLILDEATSSIDTRTEIKIQNAFSRLMKGRTSFIVAHRLSTIQNADIILVMNNGQIVEQGKHTELLKKNGFYAHLYHSQFEC